MDQVSISSSNEGLDNESFSGSPSNDSSNDLQALMEAEEELASIFKPKAK